MSQTDEQLATALRGAIDAYAAQLDPLDPTALRQQGRRVVRRRRLATAGGVTAAVAAVALAVNVLPGRGQQTEVPATNTPTSSTVVVETGSFNGIPSHTLRATIKGGNITILDEQARITGTFPIPAAGQASQPVPVSKNIVVTLVPARAARFALIGWGAGTAGMSPAKAGSSPGDLVRIGSSGLSIAATVFERASDAASPGQAMWWLADGTPMTNDETGLHGTWSDGGHTFGMWLLPKKLIGGLTDKTGGATVPIDSSRSGLVGVGTVGQAGQPSWTVAGVFVDGSVSTPTCWGRPSVMTDLGSDWTFFGNVTSGGLKDAACAWTDAAGTRHTAK